ncbi:MAG: hypothetical protein ABDH16_02090 [Thermodesulfovibrionaceae bacterium]
MESTEKHLAIFTATKLESELILRNLNNQEYLDIKGFPYFKGKINNVPLLLSITGIGKINSAIASLILLNHFKVSKILIYGVAGAYPSSNLSLGEIVFCEKEIDAEKGVLVNCENSFIFMEHEEIDMYIPEAFKSFKRGVFLTVDCCSGNLQRARFLEKKFNAICENMEGAAVAKVAKIFNTSATEIRAISNIIAERKTLLTPTEIRLAATKIQKFILDNFLALTNQF